MLPFTHQQFIFVFSIYNGAIWPLQPIVHGAGLVMLALLLRPSPQRDKSSALLLAAMWIWTGLVYHIGFFSRINPVALGFGAAFVLQGVLLLEAAWRGRLAMGACSGARVVAGWTLLVYSALIYPLLGIATGVINASSAKRNMICNFLAVCMLLLLLCAIVLGNLDSDTR